MLKYSNRCTKCRKEIASSHRKFTESTKMKKIKVGKVIVMTLLEPFTPHYLVTKYRKARSAIKISYSKWI